MAKKRAREFQFGKLNFASDFYHCRFCTLHKNFQHDCWIRNDRFMNGCPLPPSISILQKHRRFETAAAAYRLANTGNAPLSKLALWKPQPRAEPDGRGEGNEAQAAHQEDMPLRNRQPVALLYCPSDWTIGTVHTHALRAPTSTPGRPSIFLAGDSA